MSVKNEMKQKEHQANDRSSLKLLLLKNQQISLTFLVMIICVVFAILSPEFITKTNILNVIRQLSYTAIAAIGATFLMVGGGIDLSIGSVQAFTGLTTLYVLVNTGNLLLALLMGLASGLLIGLINGIVITRLNIPDIIATLAMMISLRGIDYLLTDGVAIVNATSKAFNWIGSGMLLGIPFPIVLMAVLFAVSYIILKHTKLGRHIYAIGSSSEAALLSGIKIKQVKMITYLFSGATAAISAIILASRLNSGQPTAGSGYEFNVIAGVILGGCSLKGGSGNLFGTFIGMFLLTVLRNGFILVGLQSFWQEVLTGIIIIFSIWLNNYKNSVMSNRVNKN